MSGGNTSKVYSGAFETFQTTKTGSLSASSSTTLSITLSRDDFTDGELLIAAGAASIQNRVSAFIVFNDTASESFSQAAVLDYRNIKFASSDDYYFDNWKVIGLNNSADGRLSRRITDTTGDILSPYIASVRINGSSLDIVLTNENLTSENYDLDIVGRVYRNGRET